MTLTIGFSGQLSENPLLSNYVTVTDVVSWGTSAHLLIVRKTDGKVLNYPLCNVQTFYESIDESQGVEV